MRKILLFIIAIAFIGVGVFLRINASEMAKRCTVENTATVIRNIEKEDYDDGETNVLYYPEFEYKVGDKTITKTSNSGTYPAKYNVGDKVEILYNPNNVDEYLIKGDNSMNIISIVLIVIGVLVFLVGIKTLIFGR